MPDHKDHLSGAYALKDETTTRNYYDDWADTYDIELVENGYVTPERCAKALAKYATSSDIAVLDIGCGTGISGKALRREGFTNLTGTDISRKMLDKAIAGQVYDHVWLSDSENPLPFETGKYQAITAIGVIGSGAAPLRVFHAAGDKLSSGDLFVLSLNDHALAIAEFPDAVDTSVANGRFKLLSKEYGPHIAGKDLNCNVYVLKKT